MIKPLRNYIVVRREEAQTTSQGGIILTESAQDIPTQGEVIAVGPGILENGERVPMDVKVGDVVMFTQFAGKDLEVDGQQVSLMLDTDVFAIL